MGALEPFVVEHGVDLKVHVLVVYVAAVSHRSLVLEAESLGDTA